MIRNCDKRIGEAMTDLAQQELAHKRIHAMRSNSSIMWTIELADVLASDGAQHWLMALQISPHAASLENTSSDGSSPAQMSDINWPSFLVPTLLYAIRPESNSYNKTPKENMSVLPTYAARARISGATYRTGPCQHAFGGDEA